MARILLTEDDQSMCTFLATALERAGHNVTVAHDGQSALTLIEKEPPFDLLLTDIIMPGIDGIELSKKATKLHPTLKIMFITGFTAMAMEVGSQPAKNMKLMAKPFHLNDLVQQVQTLLND